MDLALDQTPLERVHSPSMAKDCSSIVSEKSAKSAKKVLTHAAWVQKVHYLLEGDLEALANKVLVPDVHKNEAKITTLDAIALLKSKEDKQALVKAGAVTTAATSFFVFKFKADAKELLPRDTLSKFK